jgi:DNA invertase Pin-like site-specific DNA recombinase
MERTKPALQRCAIYTRKSSEESLEQEFNSLHAQRETCEAFIKSQAGEGWRLLKTSSDDGGTSRTAWRSEVDSNSRATSGPPVKHRKA